MAEKVEIKFYKIDNITQATTKNSLFAVKSDNENSFKLYVTDLDGNLIPLFTSSGTGGGITNLTSTDSSILITGSAVKDLKISTTLKNLINSALQSSDPISSLTNDAGYITLADIPIFNPSDYDLEDFTNSGTDPFVKQSELPSGGVTNLVYTPSPTNGIVTSDTGTDATIPLADNTNAGLLDSAEKSKIATAIQPSDLGVVATSNDYTDLDNIPTTFTPSAHTHVEADITDLDKYTQSETDTLLNNKVDKVIGKGLSTEDYSTTEKSKLAGIESGAEVNNISDTNATDLTDGGDTTLHNHDSRYYTESEIDTFLSNINTDAIYKDTVKLSEDITKGQAVYVSGANGTNILVSKASNTTESTSSKTLGLLETTGVTNDIVKVVTSGLLSGLNTNSATIGDPVWLGTSGNLIYGLSNKPVAPAHLVYIGIVTRVSATVGEIFIKIQNGFELNEVHDVLLTSLTNNDILQYESSSGLWKNKQIVEDNLTASTTIAPSKTAVNTALDFKSDKPKLISANYTALNSDNLIVNTTCTISDITSPSNGTNYEVTIVNGSVTIDGVVYGSGVVVKRIYNSGAWESYVYSDDKEWVDYSNISTITGIATFINKVIKYKPKYKETLFYVNIFGVSNSGFLNFTIPFNAITTSVFPCAVTNNSIAQSAMGILFTTAGSDVVQVKINGTFANFTSSNNKGLALTFSIETT